MIPYKILYLNSGDKNLVISYSFRLAEAALSTLDRPGRSSLSDEKIAKQEERMTREAGRIRAPHGGIKRFNRRRGRNQN